MYVARGMSPKIILRVFYIPHVVGSLYYLTVLGFMDEVQVLDEEFCCKIIFSPPV